MDRDEGGTVLQEIDDRQGAQDPRQDVGALRGQPVRNDDAVEGDEDDVEGEVDPSQVARSDAYAGKVADQPATLPRAPGPIRR